MLGGRLDQCLAQLLSAFLLIRRYLQLFGSTALGLPLVHLHIEYVDHLVEVGSLLYGILYDHHFATIAGLESSDCAVVVCLVTIQLIDRKEHRLMQLLYDTHLVDQADLDSLLGIDHG